MEKKELAKNKFKKSLLFSLAVSSLVITTGLAVYIPVYISMKKNFDKSLSKIKNLSNFFSRLSVQMGIDPDEEFVSNLHNGYELVFSDGKVKIFRKTKDGDVLLLKLNKDGSLASSASLEGSSGKTILDVIKKARKTIGKKVSNIRDILEPFVKDAEKNSLDTESAVTGKTKAELMVRNALSDPDPKAAEKELEKLKQKIKQNPNSGVSLKDINNVNKKKVKQSISNAKKRKFNKAEFGRVKKEIASKQKNIKDLYIKRILSFYTIYLNEFSIIENSKLPKRIKTIAKDILNKANKNSLKVYLDIKTYSFIKIYFNAIKDIVIELDVLEKSNQKQMDKKMESSTKRQSVLNSITSNFVSTLNALARTYGFKSSADPSRGFGSSKKIRDLLFKSMKAKGLSKQNELLIDNLVRKFIGYTSQNQIGENKYKLNNKLSFSGIDKNNEFILIESTGKVVQKFLIKLSYKNLVNLWDVDILVDSQISKINSGASYSNDLKFLLSQKNDKSEIQLLSNFLSSFYTKVNHSNIRIPEKEKELFISFIANYIKGNGLTKFNKVFIKDIRNKNSFMNLIIESIILMEELPLLSDSITNFDYYFNFSRLIIGGIQNNKPNLYDSERIAFSDTRRKIFDSLKGAKGANSLTGDSSSTFQRSRIAFINQKSDINSEIADRAVANSVDDLKLVETSKSGAKTDSVVAVHKFSDKNRRVIRKNYKILEVEASGGSIFFGVGGIISGINFDKSKLKSRPHKETDNMIGTTSFFKKGNNILFFDKKANSQQPIVDRYHGSEIVEGIEVDFSTASFVSKVTGVDKDGNVDKNSTQKIDLGNKKTLIIIKNTFMKIWLNIKRINNKVVMYLNIEMTIDGNKRSAKEHYNSLLILDYISSTLVK